MRTTCVYGTPRNHTMTIFLCAIFFIPSFFLIFHSPPPPTYTQDPKHFGFSFRESYFIPVFFRAKIKQFVLCVHSTNALLLSFFPLEEKKKICMQWYRYIRETNTRFSLSYLRGRLRNESKAWMRLDFLLPFCEK